MNVHFQRCVGLFVCLASAHALAQGCASCYTITAAGGSQTIHALRNGIIVLGIPPLLIFGGLIVLLRRWSSRASGSSGACETAASTRG
jgi:hypothetical protein